VGDLVDTNKGNIDGNAIDEANQAIADAKNTTVGDWNGSVLSGLYAFYEYSGSIFVVAVDDGYEPEARH
jgi:hypothetical protein